MKLPFETDEGFGRRATIGLVVIQADRTIEMEYREMMAFEGVALHQSRVASAPEVTPEALARMGDDIPGALELLPYGLDFDVIGYACTSGTTILGERRVEEMIRKGRPETKATNPLSAVKAACRALDVKRLGFVTPYVPEVSSAMRTSLEEDGITIAGFGSFEQSDEATVANITPRSILDALISVGRAESCDAVFASCTNLRTATVIERAEKELGLPVVTSNQALAWHMLRLAGIPDKKTGLGKLFTLPAAQHPDYP